MESIFSSFPNISLAQWKDKLNKDLKGLNFDDLSYIENNGIKIVPFYNNENQVGTSKLQFTNSNWEICSLIIVTDNKQANEDALKALNSGASGIIFQFENENTFDFSVLLKGIQLEYIYTSFKIKKNIADFNAELITYLETKNIDLKDINLNIDYDPIRDFLEDGEINAVKSSYFTHLNQHQKTTGSITVDTTVYQNAGFNSTTQLGLSLAHLNEYLNNANEEKTIDQINKVNIKIALGTDFFEEIAKMRAVRILSANIFKTYGIDVKLSISAENSDIYRSQLDKYNNILRDCISGMAAVVGGCDNLYIHDFDKDFQENHSFSERISRNQQLIFKEEAYLDTVADIASGSYYLETLTQEISTKAWQIFQEIEKEGGLISYIESGAFLKKAAEQAQDLIEEYQSGKRTLIGVTKHINKTEASVSAIKEKTFSGVLKKINIASALSI